MKFREIFFKARQTDLAIKNVYIYRRESRSRAMRAYFGGDVEQFDREISQHLKALGKDAKVEKSALTMSFI